MLPWRLSASSHPRHPGTGVEPRVRVLSRLGRDRYTHVIRHGLDFDRLRVRQRPCASRLQRTPGGRYIYFTPKRYHHSIML